MGNYITLINIKLVQYSDDFNSIKNTEQGRDEFRHNHYPTLHIGHFSKLKFKSYTINVE